MSRELLDKVSAGNAVRAPAASPREGEAVGLRTVPSEAWMAYQGRSYFPELDGLRALSILVVVAHHMHDRMWLWLNAPLGVTIFFVLSGYLITTLALREERKRGDLCYSAFYIRRTFRIFPSYYLVLGLYCLTIFGLGMRPESRGPLLGALPYYLTYFQEIPFVVGVNGTFNVPFVQSWSLGIEEKFYLVWPLLAFGLWKGGRRVRLIGTIVLTVAFASAPMLTYVGLRPLGQMLVPYYRILIGCLVAILLDDPVWFGRLRTLARPVATWMAVAVLLWLHFSITSEHEVEHLAYSVVCGILLVCLLMADSPIRKALSWGPMVLVGKLSYGMYLLQYFGLNAAEKIARPGTGRIEIGVLALLLAWGITGAMAYGLAVTVERPSIALGRRLSARAIAAHVRRRAGSPRVAPTDTLRKGIMGGEAKAIILAGGLGTRLRPLTDTIPKCLVPIADRPLLDYWVDRLADAGVREARVNNHAHADQVREYVAKVTAGGRLKLAESFEPVLLGSAGTIAANADLADGADAVIIIYADNFSDVDLKRMLAFHRSHGDPFTMLLFRAPNPSACGIAELDDDDRVVSFVEKPKEPVSDLANGGVYIVDADAYREIAAMHAFDLGFEVLPKFVGRMRGWAWEGYHLDVGTLEALEKARRDAPGLLARPTGEPTGDRPAVFLDRDGTVIEQEHYLSDPTKVRLVSDAGSVLRRLRDAGFALVVVTNQSAIGRGLLTVEQYERVNAEMVRQLAAEGVRLDAIYHCPEAPVGDDRTVITHGDRKPGPGMLLRASADLGLDPSASWMVGDMISDVLAGINAGCRGSLLVETGKGLTEDEARSGDDFQVVPDLSAAADVILGSSANQAATLHPESRNR